MADENTPAFYPRVGQNIAKNFRSAQPPAFIEDPRAMDLPQSGDVDLSVPTQANLEISRRMAQRQADLKRQQERDRSPLEKVAGALQAGRFLGSALTQAINSAPTRLFKGDEAADKFIQDRIYKPEQPLAYEYAGDVGDFLEKLETQYKLPPILPEAVALQYLTGPATAQAARAAGRGAEQVGRKIESAMEPVVKGAFERGGLPREMVMAMGANTQSNVVKPYGGNWLGGGEQLGIPENDLRRLKRNTAGGNDPVDVLRRMHERYTPEALEGMQEERRQYTLEGIAQLERDVALNKWIDSNLKNYVKKEMGTRDDPVRKLAEEGIIHTPLFENLDTVGYLQATRKAEGYPAEGMGKSELAKRWENLTDDSIRVTKAGKIQEAADIAERVAQARANLNAYKQQLDQDFLARMSDHTGNKIFSEKEAEMLLRMPEIQKAEILGDTKYKELKENLYQLMAREQGFEKRAGELNPFVSKLDPETRLYSGGVYNLGFDHIVDVLREDITTGRIRPEQLNKVSMEQAVRRTYEYDQEMAKRMREAAIKQTEGFPTYKEYPEGFRWIEIAPPKELPQGYSAILDDVTSSYKVVDENGKEAFPRKPNDLGHINVPYFKTAEEAIADALQRDPRLENALKYEGDTMGHCVGGYCQDVRDGNTKIYSLRDAKGEPHVTIEVVPKKHLDYNTWFNKQPEEIQNRIAQRRKEDKNHDIYEGPEYLAAREALPPIIKQIKGKQNAKPKEEYLPFVQDFVRGGNWSDVRDFQNTGLRRIEDVPERARFESAGMKLPKYVTEADHEALINEYLKLTSHPTDLDFMHKAYGFPKPDAPPPAGMKAGGKVSISNNPDTMMLELNNQKMKNGVPAYGAGKAVTKQALKAAKPEVMKASEALGRIEGRPLKITQADRTKVGGGYLGGPGFSGLQLTEPEYRAAEAAWAVQNAGTAKTILGGEGDNAVYAAMLGTPTQHQSNQMVFDKLLGDFKKAAKRGELTPELRDLINMRLAASVDKKGNPVFPADVDIMDKKFRDIANTFSRRSIAGHLMGGVQVGGKKGQIIDYDKIIRSTTDPALIDQPTGAVGNRLFTLSGGIIDRPDLHPAFPAILQGEDLGLTFTPVERNLVMKDFVEKTMREKGRKPGYMDYTRGNPPTQLITEDILTELQKLGKKKGGAVKKAEGGEVTGDDLILEERPL